MKMMTLFVGLFINSGLFAQASHYQNPLIDSTRILIKGKFKDIDTYSVAYYINNFNGSLPTMAGKIPVSFYPVKVGRLFVHSTAVAVTMYGISLTALFLTPAENTHWTSSFSKELFANAGEHFHDAWTKPPVMDYDNFYTNYITHPYIGNLYYNTMRSKGASLLASFAFSAFASSLWEYGPEALFEQPSIQDLISTPIIGSIIGEGVHQLTIKMSKGGFNTMEKIVLLILNPVYVFHHHFHPVPQGWGKKTRAIKTIDPLRPA